MSKTYTPQSITKTFDEDGNATFSYSYIREATLADGEKIVSQPHRGSFADNASDRAKEVAVAVDGHRKTGQKILEDFGLR